MSLAYDLDVLKVLDRPAHTGDDQRMIVRDQDPDRRRLKLSSGNNGKLCLWRVHVQRVPTASRIDTEGTLW